jgi:peptidoglycan/LPS O-acetylase OafA/YrhL
VRGSTVSAAFAVVILEAALMNTAHGAGTARYATLDGLRGIAALAIVGLHITQHFLGLLPVGATTAVDFFFLLSGFVLAKAFPKPDVDFLVARVIRLWPMALLGSWLGIALLFAASGVHWDAGSVLALGALPDFTTRGFPANPPLWSVAFEAIASVVYFLVARRLHPVVILAIIGALAIAAPNRLVYWGWPAAVRCLLPFFVGLLLADLPGAEGRSPVWSALSVGGLVLMLGLQRAHPAVLAAAFAAIVTCGRAEPLPILRAPMLWLGRISYPLYALHFPIVVWATAHHLTDLMSAVGVLAASILAAHAAAALYDEPVRRWLTRLWRGASAAMRAARPARKAPAASPTQ